MGDGFDQWKATYAGRALSMTAFYPCLRSPMRPTVNSLEPFICKLSLSLFLPTFDQIAVSLFQKPETLDRRQFPPVSAGEVTCISVTSR
jgi:hypothetical protein